MVQISRHYLKVIINSMYPQVRVIVALKTYRSETSYWYNVSFFILVFSNSFEFKISQELPLSIRTMYTSDLSIIVVITKGKSFLGCFRPFHYCRIRELAFFIFVAEVLPSFLMMPIILIIFLFIVLLEGLLNLMVPPFMEGIYWHFPLCPSSSLLLTYFTLPSAITSTIFLRDCFFLGKSFRPFFPFLVYSDNGPSFIIPSIRFFS